MKTTIKTITEKTKNFIKRSIKRSRWHLAFGMKLTGFYFKFFTCFFYWIGDLIKNKEDEFSDFI